MTWSPTVNFLIQPEPTTGLEGSHVVASPDVGALGGLVAVTTATPPTWLTGGVLRRQRLRYHLQDGESGVSTARNSHQTGRSPRLLTLDSDDLNHPHRAARCRELLDPQQPQLIYTRVRLFSTARPSGRAKPVLQPYSGPLLEMVNFITNPGTAFTRRAIEAAGEGFRPSLSLAEDYDLYLRMARAGVTIRAIDEEHVSYRKHSNATTSRRHSELHDAVMAVHVLIRSNPFLEAIQATPCRAESESVGDADQRALWQDDRWRDA